MTLCYYLVQIFGANISNFRRFRGFTILSGFNSQLRVYGDDFAVDPSKIFFHMVYRIAVQNLALLSGRSASFQKLGLICPTRTLVIYWDNAYTYGGASSVECGFICVH